MAIQIQLPSAIKKQLIQSSGKGIYEVKYPEEWFGDERAKLGKLVFKAKDGSEHPTFIQGVRDQSKKLCSLFVDIHPKNKDKYSGKLVSGTHEFVTGGLLIQSTFKVKNIGSGKLLGREALMINIHNISVTINVISVEIPEKEVLNLKYRIRNKWYDAKVKSLSLAHINIISKLDPTIIGEGRFVEKASLKKGNGYTFEPIKVFLQPGKENGEFIAVIRKIRQMGLKQIASIVDKIWKFNALNEYKIKNQPASKKSKNEKHEHIKTAELADHIYTPRVIFLGDSKDWEQKVSSFAEIKQYGIDNSRDTVGIISKERCDIIIADADMGMKNIFSFAVELKLNTDLQNTPIFWIANSENENLEQEKAILMESGAFDYLERDMDSESLESIIRWTLNQNVIGEGEELVLLGRDLRSNYQLGLELVKGKLRVSQDSKLDNPIDTLNQSEASWILINSRGMGDSYKPILNSSLIWTKKKSHKCHVFLLSETLLQPEEEQRWARAGISEIFIYDTNVKTIAERIVQRMEKVDNMVFIPSAGPGLPSPVIQRQLRKQMDDRYQSTQ